MVNLLGKILNMFWRKPPPHPLGKGKIYTYEPGVFVSKETFVDKSLQTPNDNPVTLDSTGRAVKI